MWPRVVVAVMDLFFTTEEDYHLKSMHFAIFVGQENIIICTKSFIFNVQGL